MQTHPPLTARVKTHACDRLHAPRRTHANTRMQTLTRPLPHPLPQLPRIHDSSAVVRIHVQHGVLVPVSPLSPHSEAAASRRMEADRHARSASHQHVHHGEADRDAEAAREHVGQQRVARALVVCLVALCARVSGTKRRGASTSGSGELRKLS
eukprot:357921-Chlamydomonas_euryale.AAC.1